jgi:hypothetical protein
MSKTLNGLFRTWMRVAQADGSPPVIWGRCIVHLGNPLFSGRILHTSGVVEISRHKGVAIAETRNNYYALLGPEVIPPPGGRIDPAAFLEAQPDDRCRPLDVFASAALNAERDCPRCHGQGVYPRSEGSLAICDLCCKHNQGWWRLEGGYGRDNGRWACKAGCGVIVDRPTPELEFLPRAGKVSVPC